MEQSPSWEAGSYKFSEAILYFCGIPKHNTIFTKTCHWALCWNKWIVSTLPQHIFLSLKKKNTGLFKMIVGVLTTCHTQYIWDRSICIFVFNRTTLQIFVTYLIVTLYVHPLWFYEHQHDNRVRSKLFVACNNIQLRDTCGKRRNINLILDVTP